MLDTIYSGPLNCGMFQMKAANLQNNTYPPAFPLKHMTKDAKFIVDTAFELGAPAPAAWRPMRWPPCLSSSSSPIC